MDTFREKITGWMNVKIRDLKVLKEADFERLELAGKDGKSVILTGGDLIPVKDALVGVATAILSAIDADPITDTYPMDDKKSDVRQAFDFQDWYEELVSVMENKAEYYIEGESAVSILRSIVGPLPYTLTREGDDDGND